MWIKFRQELVRTEQGTDGLAEIPTREGGVVGIICDAVSILNIGYFIDCRVLSPRLLFIQHDMIKGLI